MNVRPFALSDLEAAARFCDAARARDPLVEPFGEGLSSLATGGRARLSVWRVLEGDDGKLRGIAFAAARDAATVDVYAAVDPALRRQGFGRALFGPSLGLPETLRARVFEESLAGRAFVTALGFAQHTAQLSLRLAGPARARLGQPAFFVRSARREDEAAIRRLTTEAWAGAPDVFAPRPGDEVLGADRVVWLAERDGQPAGYLAARKLGTAVAIEEVAVLPGARRLGIGRALVERALQGVSGAVLSVAEDNLAARALYDSLGFSTVARRLVYERETAITAFGG
jgi:ribosomal-protein-alanine N-acetyltransferase